MKNKDQMNNAGTNTSAQAGDVNKDLNQQHQEGTENMTEKLIDQAINLETKEVEDLADRIKAQFPTPNFDNIPLIKSHGDNMLGQYNNAAAAAVGVALAVGLELVSPTGTKTSAAVAAIAGAGAIALGAGAHTNMPQNALTMGVSGVLGFKIAKGFGRLTIEYFPAVKEVEKDSDPAVTFVEVPAI